MDVVKGKVSKKVTKFSDFAYFCLSGEQEFFFERTDCKLECFSESHVGLLRGSRSKLSL